MEDLEAVAEVLLLLAYVVNELTDASLYLVTMVNTSLQVVVLQLEELVEVSLHFILHLH